MQWRNVRQLLALIITIQMVLAPFPVSAAKMRKTRLAVVPLRDGQSDQSSTELSQVLADALRRMGDFQIVDPKNVESLRSYHQVSDGAAPAGVTEARQALASAKQNFLQFRNKAAAREAQRVTQLFASHPEWRGEHGQLLVDAWLTEAMVAHAAGKKKERDRILARLAQLAPTLSLQADHYPPSFAKQLVRAQAAQKKQGQGSAQIASTPPAAEVRLNGVKMGVTPLTLSELPVNDYDLAIVASRYRTVQKKIHITSHGEEQVTAKLRWARQGKRKPARTSRDPKRSAISAAGQLAQLARSHRVVTVNVDKKPSGAGTITAQLIDGGTQVGREPITIKFNAKRTGLHAELAQMARRVAKMARQDPHHVAPSHLLASDTTDPAVLNRRKKKISPVIWAALGAVAVGGVVAGVLLSRGGGGDGTGAVLIRFK